MPYRDYGYSGGGNYSVSGYDDAPMVAGGYVSRGSSSLSDYGDSGYNISYHHASEFQYIPPPPPPPPIPSLTNYISNSIDDITDGISNLFDDFDTGTALNITGHAFGAGHDMMAHNIADNMVSGVIRGVGNAGGGVFTIAEKLSDDGIIDVREGFEIGGSLIGGAVGSTIGTIMSPGFGTAFGAGGGSWVGEKLGEMAYDYIDSGAAYDDMADLGHSIIDLGSDALDSLSDLGDAIIDLPNDMFVDNADDYSINQAFVDISDVPTTDTQSLRINPDDEPPEPYYNRANDLKQSDEMHPAFFKIDGVDLSEPYDIQPNDIYDSKLDTIHSKDFTDGDDGTTIDLSTKILGLGLGFNVS